MRHRLVEGINSQASNELRKKTHKHGRLKKKKKSVSENHPFMKCSFAEGECFRSHPKYRYSHCLWKPQTVWSPEFPGWKEVWGLMCSVQMAEQPHSSPGWGIHPWDSLLKNAPLFFLMVFFFNNCMNSFGWTMGKRSKKCKELGEDPVLGVAGTALIQPLHPKKIHVQQRTCLLGISV